MNKQYLSAFTKTPVLIAALFITLILPLVSLPELTHASTSNTRLDPWGTPEGDTSWYPGGGVQIYSNGSSATYDSGVYNCFTMTGGSGGLGCGSGTVPTGIEWQCVELFNRFYMAKGWITSRWAGNGNTLINATFPTGFSQESATNTTYINPGDAITFTDGTPDAYHTGHVVIVSSVSGSTVTVASQNTQGISWTVNWNSSTHTITQTYLGSDYSVQAIIHRPLGSGSPSSYDLNQFYVYGGAWNVYDVTTVTNVHIVGDPYEDSNGGIWARDSNNDLRQFYIDSTTNAWTAFDVSTAVGGVQIASDVMSGPGGVLARGTNNHLYQFYVTSSGAWTAFDVSTAVGGVNIAGDPFEDTNGGIWARDTSNHLRQFYVANGSWTAFDVTGATGVSIASNPSVGAGGIFARDVNNQLRQFYVANGSWTAANPSGATGVNVAGNPVQDSGGGIWIRDVNNHLRQFYVSGSWVAFDVSGATGVSINGDPGIGSGGDFARDTNNHLRQFYVSNGAWTAADISGATGYGIHTNPVSGSGGEFAGS